MGDITGPVTPRQVYTVDVAGTHGVPADAEAVLVNVTVTGPTTVGNLRVFPGGQPVPGTSVVNFAAGRDKATSTIVSLADGAISFYADSPAAAAVSPVHVVLDVVGYVEAGSEVVGVEPQRLADSREWLGLYGPLLPRVVESISLTAAGPVPVGATAVVLNVTAIGPNTNGNLRVYPDTDGGGTTPPPNASVINYIPGRDIPNQVVVALPSNGLVNFWSDTGAGGVVDIAVDVVGYVTAVPDRR